LPAAPPQYGGGHQINSLDTNYTISTEEFESIEQYLLGETSTEQRLTFESKMKADISWAAKVNEVKLLLVGIETASLKERLDNYHINIKKNHLPTSGGKVISMRRKWMVAASVALLVAMSVWVFTTRENKYQKLYATYYKPDPGLMSAMGASDNYLFNKAMLDYKTGDYKKAIDEWSKLKTGMPQNDTLSYFLGVAQQANGNSAAAITLLKSMTADSLKPFYKDACWYTGLAFLKQSNVNEAIPYLEKSARPESSELINKLK
jgi:tetratricopeptide (TPR) repeat protein